MEFKKLSNVDLVENMGENTHVLIEEGGEIKKVSSKEVGSSIPTAIIQSTMYMEAIDYFKNPMEEQSVENVDVQPMVTTTEEYECINMTFEEVWGIITEGKELNCIIKITDEEYPRTIMSPCQIDVVGYRRLVIRPLHSNYYIWTDEGISLPEPE